MNISSCWLRAGAALRLRYAQPDERVRKAIGLFLRMRAFEHYLRGTTEDQLPLGPAPSEPSDGVSALGWWHDCVPACRVPPA